MRMQKILGHKATQNFCIMSAIAVIQVMNNVLIGRALTKEQFGIYSFVFLEAVGILAFLLMFGQDTSIIRNFSSRNIRQYDWRRYFIRYFVWTSMPLAFLCLLILMVYRIPLLFVMYIAAGVSMALLGSFVSAFLRSAGRINLSLVIARSSPLFFLVFLSALYVSSELHFQAVMLCKLLSYGLVLPLVAALFLLWGNGSKPIEKQIVSDGLRLWQIDLVNVLGLNRIDAFFIVKLLSLKDMALYAVMRMLMQGYEFVAASLWNVYSHRFSHDATINKTRLFGRYGILATVITLFYLAAAKPILLIVFGGKYSASWLLLVLFCGIGIIRIMNVLPSCYIIGQGSGEEMRFYFWVSLVSVVVKVVSMPVMSVHGLEGILMSNIIAYSVHLAGGLFVAGRKRIGSLVPLGYRAGV